MLIRFHVKGVKSHIIRFSFEIGQHDSLIVKQSAILFFSLLILIYHQF